MIGVIDIGSNSARLLLNGKKTTIICQLSENLIHTQLLCKNAIERTFNACLTLKNQAVKNGATHLYFFGTEALRSAKNASEFLSLMSDNDMPVRLLSKDEEAQIGFLGAYTSGTQAVIDIGGASSELAVGSSDGLIYSHSLPIGCVRIKDFSPIHKERLDFVKAKIQEYGVVPPFEELINIGGSSALASMFLKLEPFDPKIVHNFVLTKEQLKNILAELESKTVEERKSIVGLDPRRADVLPSSGMILLEAMEYLKVDKVKFSELDNLEGFLSLVLAGKII